MLRKCLRFVGIVFVLVSLVVVVALAVAPTVIHAQGPSVGQPEVHPHGSECSKDLYFHSSGFAPNSPIMVTSTFSETVCQTGQASGGTWGPLQGASSDGAGSFVWGTVNSGTGTYHYVFSDNAGHVVNVDMTTNKDGSVASYSQQSNAAHKPVSTTVPVISTSVPPGGVDMTNARNGNGIQMSVYCQDKGQGTVVDPTDGNAYHWMCGSTPVDMDRACKEVWDGSYSAWLDPTSNPPKYGWRCLQGQVPQQPTSKPPNPQPVGCPLPIRLSISMQGRVVYGQGPTNLRTQPQGDVIIREPEGSVFTVTYGPICGDLGNNWFRVVMNDGNNGWMPEGNAAGTIYWLEPFQNQPTAVQQYSTPVVPNATRVNQATCSGANPKRVGNGSVAQTTQGVPSNVRQDHSVGSQILRKLQPGTQVTIIGEAVCGVNSAALPGWWWPVRLGDGLTGWMLEGAGGDWVLEPISPAPATSVPVQQATSVPVVATAVPVTTSVEDVTLELADGSSFTFKWDSKLDWILNGSDFVIEELSKISSRVDAASSLGDKVSTLFPYMLPVVGTTDKNMMLIRDHFCNHDKDCEFKIEFKIGNRTMDLSGVGNVAYGYFLDSLNLPLRLSDNLANWDQLISSLKAGEYLTTRDNPDDIQQRLVGRMLRKSGLSLQNLNDIADEVGLY